MGWVAVVLLMWVWGGLTPAPQENTTFTVCSDDQANVGFDSNWVAYVLSLDWNADVTADCEDPDVFLTIVHMGYGGPWWPDGWIYEAGGPIWVDARVLNKSLFDFRVVLSHEVGHHFGMQHVDTVSVMTTRGRYLPTPDDQSKLAEILCRGRK